MDKQKAGIYLHIPFCKQACYYCNFHFSTSLRYKKQVINALKEELILRQHYLRGASIGTIYFGGGTPSLLKSSEVKDLLAHIQTLFPCVEEMEVTLEGNPDDLSLNYLRQLWEAGVNRLSIGIQSFDDQVLASLNRAHSGKEAHACVNNARKAGFTNFSIDLMYGLPARPAGQWAQEINTALSLAPPHISAYCLTIEPNTVFGHRKKRGSFIPLSEEIEAEQFTTLKKMLEANGYVHYEISNFCQLPYYAKHNTHYWQGVPYLGIGPSAHSYDGKSRQYNVAHNKTYIDTIAKKTIPARKEFLSAEDHINEYIMLSLRTVWGCDLTYMRRYYYHDLLKTRKKEITLAKEQGLLTQQDTLLLLTPKGQLVADEIAKSLFNY
ncbi:MAG: radical SAM family heme chaperone HemW [Bacteroidota bacterium]